SMAKSLGGGFPMGAFWVREKFANVLSAGTHASTFGGTPLACAVALKIFDVIECEKLAENARDMGDFLLRELQKVQQRFPKVVKIVRGLGLMIGIEFQPQFKAVEIVKELHQRNLLTVPAGNSVARLLPALNLSRGEAEAGLRVIEKLVVDLADKEREEELNETFAEYRAAFAGGNRADPAADGRAQSKPRQDCGAPARRTNRGLHVF